MASTTFTDNATTIYAAWLNDVNTSVYKLLGDGTNAPTTAANVLTNLGFSAYVQTLIGAASASAARTTLGLGTIATQNANAVAITGGTVDGTQIGPSTASNARFTAVGAPAFNPASNTNAALTLLGGFGGGIAYNDGGGYIGLWSTNSGTTLNIAVNGTSAGWPSTQLLINSNSVQINTLLDLSLSGSAGQIKFPATQNASADPNTLDDYEEGTWTPGAAGTATYLIQVGTYTKIGNRVSISINYQINVIGTGATTTIWGLPFAGAAPSGHLCDALVCSFWANLALSVTYLTFFPNSASLLAAATTAAATNITSSAAVFGNSSQVQIGGTYQT